MGRCFTVTIFMLVLSSLVAADNHNKWWEIEEDVYKVRYYVGKNTYAYELDIEKIREKRNTVEGRGQIEILNSKWKGQTDKAKMIQYKNGHIKIYRYCYDNKGAATWTFTTKKFYRTAIRERGKNREVVVWEGKWSGRGTSKGGYSKIWRYID